MTTTAPPNRAPRAGSIGPRPLWAWLAAAWGVLGVAGILLFAVYRLTPYAIAAIAGGLTPLQWLVLAANTAFMAWSEGYRGFQCRFSPRVAARALHLLLHPTPLRALLAPVFCIGYFHASRRGMVAVWAGTLAIVGVVLLVQLLSQPWRGILDAGVVVGLTWGLVSFLQMVHWTLSHGEFLRSPELPDSLASKATGGSGS
jgi:hypothetical protein